MESLRFCPPLWVLSPPSFWDPNYSYLGISDYTSLIACKTLKNYRLWWVFRRRPPKNSAKRQTVLKNVIIPRNCSNPQVLYPPCFWAEICKGGGTKPEGFHWYRKCQQQKSEIFFSSDFFSTKKNQKHIFFLKHQKYYPWGKTYPKQSF